KGNTKGVIFYFLSILAVIAFMASCKKEKEVVHRLGIIPSFSVTPTQEGGNEVVFENTSQGDYSGLSWNFGNLTTSDKEGDTVLYMKKGTYTVQLNLYKEGDSVSTTQRVRVDNDFSNNMVNFEAKPSEENTNKIIFTNATKAKVDSLKWDFDNGEGSSQAKDTVLFAFKGIYKVSLTVFVGEQSFKKTKKINIEHIGFAVSFETTPLSTPGEIAVENTT